MEPQPPFRLPSKARDGIAILQLIGIAILALITVTTVVAIVGGIVYSVFFA